MYTDTRMYWIQVHNKSSENQGTRFMLKFVYSGSFSSFDCTYKYDAAHFPGSFNFNSF